jgi:hypothetical protein
MKKNTLKIKMSLYRVLLGHTVPSCIFIFLKKTKGNVTDKKLYIYFFINGKKEKYSKRPGLVPDLLIAGQGHVSTFALFF